MCQEPNCIVKHASYGKSGTKKATHCSLHGKILGLEDVKHNKCQKTNCKTLATFGKSGTKIATHCSLHGKILGLEDVKNKLCKTSQNCGGSRANLLYDDYCTFCFMNLFPNDPRTLNMRKKPKELAVVVDILQEYPEMHHDKPLYSTLGSDGCCTSKRRIDLRMLINGTILAIEIDEFEHKAYIKSDEINRYDDLFMDFSGHYIFIRYNPDPYNINGLKMNPDITSRLAQLKQEISNQITRILNDENTELVEIHHLFYSK